MKISGIYQIQSKRKPERIYIGSSVSIDIRWSRHISCLKKNKHQNKKLQAHYNKYGNNDLQFSILLSCEKEDLLKVEQYFIDSYNPWFNHYRIAGSPIGHKHSDESIKKMKGNTNKRGKPCSDETKEKLSLLNKGKKQSEETRRKNSESVKLSWVKRRLEGKDNRSKKHLKIA